MMDYDFSALSPHDFELLTQDLLQRELGVRLEGFKSGRDRGVDLRRCEDRSTGLVVQCKHYLRSPFSKLKSELKKKELPKITKLAPKRYIVATSRPLSVKEKDDLVAVLGKYCRSPEDVLGAEDLNALLRKYPEIEKTHFKLWVASTAVLQAILHNDLFSRNYLEIEDIKTRLSLFVPTAAVERAMTALQEHGFCLLSGIPGIGKTTTAEMLVALMLEDGWECVCVSSNASEALKAYDRERRQLFYYDDFLGQTSFSEKLGKNEDHDLNRLIKTCKKRPNSKRLILTTRNYILAQALEQHEGLTRSDINVGECTIELADYTPRVRAQILVNHLWFYGVEETWCSQLVATGTARKIVDHAHYSPRLVEAMCKRASSDAKSASTFAKNALALLDDPRELWRHPFQNQLGDPARELLVCFASVGNGCYMDALQQAYNSLANVSGDDITSADKFRRALRELEGTFIEIDSDGKRQIVSYNNPSVKDFMDGIYDTTTACSKRVLKSAHFYSQVTYAAEHLLGPDKHPDDETLVSAALRTHILAESVLAERVYGNVYKVAQLQPATRLLTWRDSYAKTPHRALATELVKLSIEYLNGGNYYNDNADDISRLIRLTASDAADLEVAVQLDLEVVKTWLWRNLKSVYDYISMKWWVDDWAGEEPQQAAYEQLREHFERTTEKILDDLATGSHSSSHIEEEIGNILMAADEIGVAPTNLDMDEAEAALAAAKEEEDREADMRQEEWQLRRMEELAEKDEVDDILDSLR